MPTDKAISAANMVAAARLREVTHASFSEAMRAYLTPDLGEKRETRREAPCGLQRLLPTGLRNYFCEAEQLSAMSRTEVTLRVGLLELMLLALGEVELLLDS